MCVCVCVCFRSNNNVHVCVFVCDNRLFLGACSYKRVGLNLRLVSFRSQNTNPLLRQTSFYVSRHGLPVTILKAVIPLAH